MPPSPFSDAARRPKFTGADMPPEPMSTLVIPATPFNRERVDAPLNTTIVFNGASTLSRLNGAAGITNVDVGSGGMTAPVNLGRRAASENGLGGMPGSYVGEVIVYDSAIAGANLTDVEAYLVARWFTAAGKAPRPWTPNRARQVMLTR